MKIRTASEYQNLCSKYSISFLQSYEWGEVKRPEWEPLRLVFDDYPITILIRRIPLPLIKWKIAYIPRPFYNFSDFAERKNLSGEAEVIPEVDQQRLKRILKGIVAYLKGNGEFSHVEIDPSFINSLDIQQIFTEVGFVASGEQYQLNNTNIIDLSCGIESLWKSLDSQTRNKIGRPEKLGCKFEMYEKGEEPIERFWKIMDSITKTTTYITHPKEYFKKVWRIMSGSNKAVITLITCDEMDIGGYFSTKSKDTLWELYGGLNEEGKKIRGAGYFLKWKSIENACKLGIKFYDQWGTAPLRKIQNNLKYDKGHALYNISLFKKEFGGEHFSYLPKQVYVFNDLLYKTFNLGNFGFTLFKKLRKML